MTSNDWPTERIVAAKNAPGLAQYWAATAEAVPEFTPEEQRVAVTLYRELAKGKPVNAEQLARALGVVTEKARELLGRQSIKAFVYPDEQGRVLGFGGLAAAPMHHKFAVDGRTLWTWCAWDSLFIPEILGQAARVESPDPETGQVVRLTVTPEGVESADPEIVVSFLLPDSSEFEKSAANVMATFCHFVFFFASRESGERWAAKHAGTFLYSLDEAVELARRLNAKMFGYELAQRSTRTP
ncbi:MAG: organomercurial lyase [Gemmatimonadales bacterium]